MHTNHVKTFLLFIAIPISLLAVTLLLPDPSSGTQQFRGVVRYPVRTIGGEGSGVTLATATKAYTLLLPPDLPRGRKGQMPDGASVIVVGIPGQRKGIERGLYDVIEVVSMSPDAIAPDDL